MADTFGLDAGWRMCSNSTLTLGYEVNEADNDRDAQRVNLGLVITF